jgi:hypothetical protein
MTVPDPAATAYLDLGPRPRRWPVRTAVPRHGPPTRIAAVTPAVRLHGAARDARGDPRE